MLSANRSRSKGLRSAALLLIAAVGLSSTAYAEPPADDALAVLFAGSGSPNRFEWAYPIETSLVPRMGPRDVIGEGPFAVARDDRAALLRAAKDPGALRMRASAELENLRFLRENVFKERVPLKLMFPEDPKLSSLGVDRLPREIMFKLKDGKLVPTMLNEELTIAVNEFGYAPAFVRAPGDPNSIILRYSGANGGALTKFRGALRAGPAIAMVAYGFVPQEGRNEIVKLAGQPDAGAWSQIAGWMVIAGDLSEGPIWGDFFQNRERFQRFFGIGAHKPPTALERSQAEARARQNDAAFAWLMANRVSARPASAPAARPREIRLYEVKGKLYDDNGKYAGPAYPGWQQDLSRSNGFAPNSGASAGVSGPTHTKTNTGTETQSQTDTKTTSSTATTTATTTAIESSTMIVR